MSDIYRELGQRVRRHRLSLGWTQEELGERARMHPAYVGQIERGVKKISLAALERLAAALGQPPGRLLSESGRYPRATWESRIHGLLRDRPASEARLLYRTLRQLAREMRHPGR